MITLISNGPSWNVISGSVSNWFYSIEYAADFMVDTYSILDDELDDAICQMVALGHTKIIFDANGRLLRTEAL